MEQIDYWKDGLRILCVRLDNLGDVLMTTPAFRALKTTWPACHLTLLTSSAGAAVAAYIPEIDQIIRFDVPWVQGSGGDRKTLLSMANRLSEYGFDAAIVFTVQSQNPLPAALLCYLAGIPRVLGYCRENPYQLMTDWVPDPEVLVATRHEVDRQLALVKTIGCQVEDGPLSIRVAMPDRDYARELLVRAGLAIYRPWVVLHPGVSEAKRSYPTDYFAQAARQLIEEHDYQIVITGSAAERPLADAIYQQLDSYPRSDRSGGQLPVLNLAGQLTIGQLIGLIAEAPGLIANNTGPVHIAAAVGTPVVVLYAKTNPQHTPWRVPNRVLYFDVPVALRSRNVLLQQFPDTDGPVASPDAIVWAVHELVPELKSIS